MWLLSPKVSFPFPIHFWVSACLSVAQLPRDEIIGNASWELIWCLFTLQLLCMRAQLLSRVRLFATPRTVAHQALLSMGFSKQEYWSGLPFPLLQHFPDLAIKLASPASSALAGILCYHWATWEALQLLWVVIIHPFPQVSRYSKGKPCYLSWSMGSLNSVHFLHPSPLGSISTGLVG